MYLAWHCICYCTWFKTHTWRKGNSTNVTPLTLADNILVSVLMQIHFWFDFVLQIVKVQIVSTDRSIVRIQSDLLHHIGYRVFSSILVTNWSTSSEERTISSKIFITLENLSHTIINCFKARLIISVKNSFRSSCLNLSGFSFLSLDAISLFATKKAQFLEESKWIEGENIVLWVHLQAYLCDIMVSWIFSAFVLLHKTWATYTKKHDTSPFR